MNKKVLAIYYSQTGQLGDIMCNLTAPLLESGYSVDYVQIHPSEEYHFPWTGKRFFDVMPESVLGVPGKLAPLNFRHSKYDLVIFGYQAWFLSPSIPANTLLHNQVFREIIRGTPVVTITGARNMWLNAFERVKTSLRDAQARLVGNIALVDKHPNLISFFTILHWMFKGRKDKWLNIFPTPGVAAEDISNARVFGEIITKSFREDRWEGMQDELVRSKAVVVKYNLMFIESKAGKMFSLWAKFISKKENRTAWLVVFKYYLFFALFIAAPIILSINTVLFRPLLSKRIKAKKQYYLELN